MGDGYYGCGQIMHDFVYPDDLRPVASICRHYAEPEPDEFEKAWVKFHQGSPLKIDGHYYKLLDAFRASWEAAINKAWQVAYDTGGMPQTCDAIRKLDAKEGDEL